MKKREKKGDRKSKIASLIDEVRLPRHTGSNKVKGFAYVQLRDRRIVPQVIEAVNKTKLDGRTITIEKS